MVKKRHLNRVISFVCALALLISFAPGAFALDSESVFPITFENGELNGFRPRENETLTVVETTLHGGEIGNAIRVSNRAINYNGPAIDVADYIEPGMIHEVSIWVKADTNTSRNYSLMAQIGEGSYAVYRSIASANGLRDTSGWRQLKGTFRFDTKSPVYIYVETNGGTESFFVDDLDFKVLPGKGYQYDPALPPLKEAYKDYFYMGNLLGGSAVDPSYLDSLNYDLVWRHFNMLSAENHMKPDFTWPVEADGPVFDSLDEVITIAKDRGQLIHGHTLAWHSQSPAWLNTGAAANYTTAKANLLKFVEQVAGHFTEESIEVYSWDVLNEAMNDNPSNPTNWEGALRRAAWYNAYANGGNASDYVYDLFVAAREAAPEAILFYNDYNDDNANKNTAIVSMAKALNQKYKAEYDTDRNLIEGIGMQGHYSTNTNLANVEASINRIIDAGLIIAVTELDVGISGVAATGPTSAQERTQALFYARLFNLYKKYAEHIDRVTIWGVEDGNSWRNTTFPTLFRSDYSAKEAFFAVLDPEGFLQDPEACVEKYTPPKLTISTDAHLVKKGGYFRVNASYNKVVDSNTAVLSYAFDTSKFDYRDFTPADGVGLVSAVATDTGAKITVMILDYSTKDYGEVLLSAKENVDLEKADNEISLNVDYVARSAQGAKEILSASASTTFKSTDDKGSGPNGEYTLIDLSNIIDGFGKTSADADWDDYVYGDFNGDGTIDILDITILAQKIA